MIQLIHGDCLDKLKELEDNSVDSIVTDPPYGLSFMGKKWDYDVPSEDIWRECLRVLKPGGHLLAFAGTRTQHRMAVRIEDAGFEIRDMIAWIYASGFPKSLNIGKAVDKQNGSSGLRGELKLGGERLARLKDGKRDGEGKWGDESGRDPYTYIPETEAAKQWEGWGTALKPALEPITVARKPLIGTVAENVLTHGTGGINIDQCRVGYTSDSDKDNAKNGGGQAGGWAFRSEVPQRPHSDLGRFPANLIHDGSEETISLFPGEAEKSASRFFYAAKASKKDRDNEGAVKNIHATVKPTDLMRYLCRLVTPPGGTVLDPFMGSGSTGKAAVKEGFSFIGIEREIEYVEIAQARINNVV